MKPFNSGHEDLVLDVSYDFYGRHLATCSADQHVKVFKLDKESEEWILSDSWRAHDASVVSVDWVAPEYGRLLATASHDKSIKIWEEDPDGTEGSGRRWTRLATLNDSSGALYGIQFAPSHLGLRLASIGNDGVLRIYDALEPQDLRVWTLTTEVKVLAIPPAHQLQSAFCLSWCPTRFAPERLAVCVLDKALIYQRGRNGKLHNVARLTGHNGLIRSVAWAPSIGRLYQLVATGCKDGKVRIFKITESTVSATNKNNSMTSSQLTKDDSESQTLNDEEPENTTEPALQVEILSEHADHGGEVWSVSWNITGTILSSTGEDGKVRLWKSTYSNEYKCMSVITSQS
ncbi:hypothetical protein TBLA_0B04670 [Henningerozyma blattae CBS 6284]|uniref:Anaphase-promoting complex subunit 4 WD40 domain-containing protein n=1 Tax=Henningerozyma blattae (strain ATCC 34711 / CBS 6284 / DSM 70876 / NBRC 10599 / NRRL Y-10934 / UCD 77-7) TaxID=1071380 RepID=I2GYV1_HENB6|nr:hypothetical protein TBLA_0B04670 [Tetrapisispora blattae CBS 6284]CCH59303.1 hypothetical protein TBLA_0B04670 [Tetrapisispora blattae CBS 6284]